MKLLSNEDVERLERCARIVGLMDDELRRVRLGPVEELDISDILARAGDTPLWGAVLAVLNEFRIRETDAAIVAPPTVAGESRAYNAGRASGIADAIEHLIRLQAAADLGRKDPV